MLSRYPLIEILEAQHIREVRNDVRHFMTRDTRYITQEEQAAWYTRYQEDVNQNVSLYFEMNQGEFVGYTYLVLRKGLWWGTLVVIPEQQGKGYGTWMYQDVIKRTKEVWIEIYADNEHSLKSAVKAGFEVVSVRDSILILRGSNDSTV